MVLDILVQERRNQEVAEAFLRRVVDGYPEAPRITVTDKLAQLWAGHQEGVLAK
jgi:transposase-like protein